MKLNLEDFKKNSGFTLIELSIVLVIIGLIVGGVLVGRDLISGSEIRAQISQIEKYNTAANTFRVKYGAFPGDIKNAEAQAFGFAARGTSPGQGNGDGIIEGSFNGVLGVGYYTSCGETGLFWRDLSDAQLIDGSFSTALHYYGIAGCNVATVISGSNLTKYYPTAKIGKNNYVYVWSGGWSVGIHNGSIAYRNYKNYFAISNIINGSLLTPAVDVSLTPNQAYAIDSKVDDGFPQSGRVLAMYPNGQGFDASGNCWSAWAAGGQLDPTDGQYAGGACDYSDNRGGPVIATSSPAVTVDVQADYNLGFLDCFDNRNVANATMQYSTQFMGGNNPACALSFQFQ